ncbi:MAG: tetratricopeptide repeat protein [Cyanobacteria bacterium]|nr:tetratricopeptide repeat protein [Cyanobacteriota bacterium]
MGRQFWIGGLVLLLGGWPGALPPVSAAIAAPVETLNQLYERGNRALDQGDYTEAERLFREAVRLDPDAAHVHIELGIALGRQWKIEDAIASYRTALALLDDPATTPNPAHAAAYLGLGYALFLRDEPGDLEAAIESYDRAIAIVPDFSEAQELRRLAQERLDSRHP